MSEAAREHLFQPTGKLPDVSHVLHTPNEVEKLKVDIIPPLLTSKNKAHAEYVINTAQQLHTQVFLDNKYITERDLDSDGVYRDEYVERSTYVIASSNGRQSACRYIRASREGFLSLPTLKNFAVDSTIIKKVAGVDRLIDVRSKEIVEVSALVSIQDENLKGSKRRGELNATRLLYAQILRESLDEGYKVWVLNTSPALVRSLKMLVGEEQVHELGERKEYLGSVTVPVAINPQEVVKATLSDSGPMGEAKREFLMQTLPGVSDKHLSPELLQLLKENNISYEETSSLKRFTRNKKALAMAGLTAYAALRAAPVANIEEFEGNPAIFLGLDVATVPPYAWGMIEVMSGKTRTRRLMGAIAAMASFVAPYAYFWAEGQDYPAYVNVVAGSIAGAAAINEVHKVRKDRTLHTKLQQEK